MHLYHLITNFFVMDTISVRNVQLFTIYYVVKNKKLFPMSISLNLSNIFGKKRIVVSRNVMEFGGWLSKVESSFSSLT